MVMVQNANAQDRQLPVLARDNVNHVMMSEHTSVDGRDELEGISLYTQGDLVIYGNWSSVGLFVHESTHNLDWWIAGEGERMYSGEFSSALSVVALDFSSSFSHAHSNNIFNAQNRQNGRISSMETLALRIGTPWLVSCIPLRSDM
jgi:hypothetical protein